jgi:hypothetical protein
MPRLLWLMFQVPMSSPQMTRTLGFFYWASAGPQSMMTNAETNKPIFPLCKCLFISGLLNNTIQDQLCYFITSARRFFA